ncbi:MULTISPECIES: type 1 glutamine amidotransferase domain-containing protein [Sphingobacterium]|uniref:Type 1 glutamine amidotransferase domain-containing protein n=1 Tax=Sphingobacterium athyrii TaxID=2152717 RepID=A0A363NZK7_9SPHI|nr:MULTISPECIES: type 1 glutamine amidotransferase domain-containing protein [Sphingobacterium]PUV26170.1 type 1 glutamine amidotransferase domain-containing protein [Sphingobacterium athyrii]QIH32960.1 type 1 glutamine amidotransferase domain-containing protein [Sphingobacterium sp. DR205]
MKKENLKVLVVLTSHDQLGDTGAKTGFWVEEFAAPYYVMADAGVTITIASPKGGQPPIDPKSAMPDFQTAATKRFDADMELQNKLANSIVLTAVDEQDYDAIFYPGGHGPLWDLANDKTSIALIESFWKHNKPVAAVCHAPGVFRFVKNTDGSPLVQGKRVTGFSNSEEEAVQLTNVVPFLVEDELVKLGGKYSKGADWSSHVIKDGKLITGQNPGSSEETARELLALLEQ